MHRFYEKNKCLPRSAIYDEAGRPLLSWRVALLPYMGEQALYNEFHLDEPWDSEHNSTLIPKMPKFYSNPRVADIKEGETTFLAASGLGTAFDLRKAIPFEAFVDGVSRPILVVEVGPKKSVPWTQPVDLSVDKMESVEPLHFDTTGKTLAVCMDAAVWTFPKTIEYKDLRRYFMLDDGDGGALHRGAIEVR
jgi:hypothetical protein